jgi:hypothetical protein
MVLEYLEANALQGRHILDQDIVTLKRKRAFIESEQPKIPETPVSMGGLVCE